MQVERKSGTKGMPSTSGMPEITGMQARVVTPATRKGKDDSNSMTARNRIASNRRTESFNRTADIRGTPAKVETLTTAVKLATACREAYYLVQHGYH
jgi:hypothetical protein